MGWIFGYRGKKPSNELKKFIEETHSPLFSYQYNNLFVSAGGIGETCLFHCDEENNSGWAVSGIGIKDSSSSTFFMEEADWQEFLKNEPDISKLNGHFVIAKWNKDSVTLYTDVIGLRDVYYAGYEDGFVFSTRADWIAELITADIDMEVFSTRWLCFNQISRKSIFTNIHRASQGEVIEIRETASIEKRFSLNIPESSKNLTGEFTERLKALTCFGLAGDYELSLGLSGGMDSRVILSLLLNQSNKNWDAHTFGSPAHPDSVVAKQICKAFNIPREQIDNPLSSGKALTNSVAEYVAGTLVNGGISSVIQLNNYSALANRNKLIIDGGFGELWRGEFFKKLQVLGKKHLMNKEYDKLLELMRVNRGDVFSEKVNKLMYEAAVSQIEELVNELPDVKNIGIAKWTNLLALRTRTLNYYGHEQARLDSIVPAYMPFLQPSLLKYLWSLPNRNNAAVFKRIIKENVPQLRKYQLAKGDVSLPYGLTSIQNRVLSQVKKRLGSYHKNNRIDGFVESYPFAESKISDIPFLDIDKIKRAANSTNTMDWLLAFVIFYNNIKKRLKTD